MKKRLQLANGCECTPLAVTPQNWKTGPKELLEKDWRIQCYFFDPKSEKYSKGYQWRIKRMNEFKTLYERREATQLILDEMNKMLTQEHYNPIYKTFTNIISEINEHTPLLDAMLYYYKSRPVTHKYKLDIKSMLKYVEISISSIGFRFTPVKDITRKNIKAILKHQQQTRGISNDRYNRYKTMMSSLFDEMIEDEVIEHNPTYKIKKLSVERRMREVLTKKEMKVVSDYLLETNYNFWRFINIWGSSGSRISEIMTVKIKYIDLANLEYKVLVKKGRQNREVIKPINKNYVDLWKELINEKINDELIVNGDYYLFAKNLKKGPEKIDPSQITRRWRVHVKDKLKITKDIYCYKHIYSDEISKQLDIKHAQRLNSHTTDRMMKVHYAVNEKQRVLERLKNIDVNLTGENDGVLEVV